MLRDGREDTFWQSDGIQPHLIDIHFQKKVRVSSVALLLNHRLDESYTPRALCVRGGNSHSDLRLLRQVEVNEPQGWVIVPLLSPEDETSPPPKLFMLQIMVVANHQNGKDTHIRAVQLFGPRENNGGIVKSPLATGALTRPESEQEGFDSELPSFGLLPCVPTGAEEYHYAIR